MAADTLHTNGTAGNADLTHQTVRRYRSTAAYTHHGIYTTVMQLFHTNAGGRTTDTGTGNSNRNTL